LEVLGVSRLHGNKVWLPKEVRLRLRVKEDDMVYFYENDDGEIVIKKSEREFKLR